jgi:itaconyl-CoA hydratase
MNQHPLYIDQHFAEAQGFEGRPIADTLIFSVIVGLSVADTSGRAIANLGFERVVFEAAVFTGDTLYAESQVLELRESESKPGRGTVAIETRGFNQRRERVMWLRRRFLVAKAGSDSRGV